MRPRPTSRLAVSWMSCSAAAAQPQRDDDARVGEEEEGQPPAGDPPPGCAHGRSVAPGAAAVNDTIAPGGAAARRALGVGLLVRPRRRRRPRVLSAGAALARRPRAAPRQRDDRPRGLARPARLGGAPRRARRRRARRVRRPRDLDRQRAAPRRRAGACTTAASRAPRTARCSASAARSPPTSSTWEREDLLLEADPRWYDREHWRDPWVEWDGRERFDMLICATRGRPRHPRPRARRATGSTWAVGPPLSAPTRHVQLEVPQLLHVGRRLADPVLRRLRRLRPALPLGAAAARPVPGRDAATCCRAAGRASTTPARCSSTAASAGCSRWRMEDEQGAFVGELGDPMPLPRFSLAAAVPVVLERPARADGPRLHAVGGGRGLELAVGADRVELGRLAEPRRARRARRRARARPPRGGRRRAARPSPATSRTARSSRGGRPAGSNTGLRPRQRAQAVGVRMSGSHSRAAAAARARPAERAGPQQPAELRAGARHRRVAGLERHHVRAEVALDPRRQRRRRAPRRRSARAAPRRRRPATSASASGARRRAAVRRAGCRRRWGAPRPARRRRASPAGRARRSASAAP